MQPADRLPSNDEVSPEPLPGRGAAATVDDMIGIGFFPDEVGLSGVPVRARLEAR
jgi:hypothetical protein